MKKNIRNYTLIEILAAMGVFMIICLVVMRFFSGAQRVIVNTSNKNNLHADVRVFFDLIGRDLQSIVYRDTVGAEGIYPFAHSYYKFDSVPLNQKSNMEKFYKNVVPKRFEKELSYDNRDYAPLLCFISSQSNLPRDADYDLSEIRYTFVPAVFTRRVIIIEKVLVSRMPRSFLEERYYGVVLILIRTKPHQNMIQE